ncbi:hypothetical protein T4A_4687 [Trichinella pseudospiralis]|uniref:Uncharacterized protein n=1 Tax=Trichinella pseudospiralis TaxID=6337 RepID=A0A0V1E7P8_TRIPS|nr:hypothetical protein T4A_4687 [Trichinella pseudospiralis]
MRYRKNKKGCKGGLTTNMDVTAVLRRIPHGDDCPMDEETADVQKHFFECIREENVPGRTVQSNSQAVQYSTVEKIGAVNSEPATISNHSARNLRLVKIVAVVCHLFFKAGYTKYVLNVQYVLSCYRLFCCRQLDTQVNNGLYLIRREFDSPSDDKEGCTM